MSDTTRRIALLLSVVAGVLVVGVCCLCTLGSGAITEANDGRPLMWTEERFPSAVLFTSDYPREDSLLLGAAGYERVRRHLEEACTYADSPWTVALRRMQELAGVDALAVVWLKHSSGGRSHIVGFYGEDVVVRPERGDPVVLTCEVEDAVVAGELRELSK